MSGACDSSDDGGGTGGVATGGAAAGGKSSIGGAAAGGATGGAATGGRAAGGGAPEGGLGGRGGAGGDGPTACADFPSVEITPGDFAVTVDEYGYCEPIPYAHTCNGAAFPGPDANSPTVHWTAGPEGTKSYAIAFKDLWVLNTTDASNAMAYNRGFHYVIWDIPADTLELPAMLGSGHRPEELPEARQWGPFNDYSFFGPCPNLPAAEGMPAPEPRNDTYSFVVYALPDEVSDVPAPVAGISTPRLMDELFQSKALAATEYRGTSDAAATSFTPPFPATSPPCSTEEPSGEGGAGSGTVCLE